MLFLTSAGDIFIQLDHRTPSYSLRIYLILSDNCLFLNRRENSVYVLAFEQKLQKYWLNASHCGRGMAKHVTVSLKIERERDGNFIWDGDRKILI